MPTLTSIDPSLIYALFKGEPGTRKSTQALSLPGPQYWFSWDMKMNGLIVPATKWGLNANTHLEYDDYNDWSKAEAKLKQFQLNCRFKTLIFDSLTSCADMTLRQTVSSKAGVTRQSGGDAGRKIAGIAVNEIEDFNAESSALQELIYLTKDIQAFHKVNIVLIAHVVTVDGKKDGGPTHFSRSIVTAGKKVSQKIPAYCSEVYHFNIKRGLDADSGGSYSLLTEHTGSDFARTALNLPREIVFNDDPIYKKWMEPAIIKLKNEMKPVATEPKVGDTLTNKFGV